MLDHNMENFLDSHILAFEALGGVPRMILRDNHGLIDFTCGV